MATKPIRERVWANAAVVVALGTVLIAVVRIYAWSGFYVPVALSVLSVADRGTLLASTLLLITLALSPLLISELVFSSRFSVTAIWNSELPVRDSLVTWAIILGLGLVVTGFASLTFAISIGGLLILVILGWLVVAIVARIKRGKEAGRAVLKARLGAASQGRVWAPVISVCAGTLITALGQSWVPLESISISGESNTYVGYLIGQQGNFTLLVDEEKRPAWFATESIEARSLCTRTIDDMWNRSIADLLSPVLLEACPRDP